MRTIHLPRQMRDSMLTHAEFCRPYESCGLVAFDAVAAPRFVYALTNRVRSADRYVVDPTEHFRAMQHAEACGWTIAGAFHSHPGGLAVPSPVDIAEARDPTWVYFIVGNGEVRAWSIDGAASELPVVDV